MKNKKAVITGTLAGILFVLAGVELLQAVIAIAAGAVEYNIIYETVYFRAEILFAEGSSRVWSAFTFLSPLVVILFIIEVSTRVISLSKPGTIRYIAIILQLIMVGFALIKIFYSTFMMVLAPDYGTDWNNFLHFGELEGVTGYLTTLVILIMVVAYLGNTTARIKKYIDVR